MVQITRGKTGNGVNAYKIFIDDVYRGKIGDNETKEFEVENGNHIVYAKILWYRSPKIDIYVDDFVVELEVGNALDGVNPWTTTPENVLLRNIFCSDNYLFLREKRDGTVEDAK